MPTTPDEFESVVADALDGIPPAFAELIENIVVQVRDEPSREEIVSVDLDPGHHTLYGLYTGVPLSERGGWYGNVLPDVVTIYRGPLTRDFRSRRELVRQIRLTVLHELGHHFGLSDAEMDAWEREFERLEP